MPANPTDDPVVLVVDDEEGLADLYTVWLQDVATVETAYSGTKALDQLDERIDVVLLDRRMPGISGDDVLEILRDRNIDARVAVVSGVDPTDDIIDMGFDEYLTKPVSRDDLRDAVDRMLTRAKYDHHVQKLLALISKRTALLQSDDRSVDERESIDELEARIECQRQKADAMIQEFDSRDFRVLFNDTKLYEPEYATPRSPMTGGNIEAFDAMGEDH